MKLFSSKDRPVHLGPFPLETLNRKSGAVDLDQVPPMRTLSFSGHHAGSLVHAMDRYMAMLDLIRAAPVRFEQAEIPENPVERANHLKAAGYFFDASMVGACELLPGHFLDQSFENPASKQLLEELSEDMPKEAPPAMEVFLPMLLSIGRANHGSISHHTHALVLLVEYTRDIEPAEPGYDWIKGTQAQRAALLTANAAVEIAEYIRQLGFEARAHTATASDVDLNRVAVSAGLAATRKLDGEISLINPFVGERFGIAAVTTTLSFTADIPLGAAAGLDGLKSHGPKWWLGIGHERHSKNAESFTERPFYLGPYPFERLKRTEKTTTFIDEERIPRFPKRADWFLRAAFGDMGGAAQDACKNHQYVSKSSIGACAVMSLGALLILQYGDRRCQISPTTNDSHTNALNVKAAAYYLSADGVGLSRVPDWAYYSHDSKGQPIDPYHTNGISMVFDQGHETMEGSSGDDWISSVQSMRAYQRFSLLGGVIAEQIRRMGYAARVHTVLDGEVLQPALLLLSGLGEVSRIGDVVLNPYLGPRLKSGVVTTSMPIEHDLPIDFGLQNFCENCNKCARECPSGSITAGPKVMYNGYEIWRSDSEKCSRYRITQASGSMCGRCMKTCPWNLEGLFSDSAFRWLAMNAPASAKTLAKMDDSLGRGRINPVKKWWWDIELNEEGNRHVQAKQINVRELNTDLDLRYEEQTLAAYPADLMPSPLPIPQPVNREAGIARYQSLLSPERYREKIEKGETTDLVPGTVPIPTPPPVFPVLISNRTEQSPDIVRFELKSMTGDPLPPFEAGAHIDVVIAPEYLRQYSLVGDPADSSTYVLGVQREIGGRGGSMMLHSAFRPGRMVVISAPRNNFPLDESADFSLLMAGGIGITPIIAMAHRLHALGKEFILHFSAKSKSESGFFKEIKSTRWADRVFFHFSKDGKRAIFEELIPGYREGFKLYACGSERYMDSVFRQANQKHWPDSALAREYFSVPESAEYHNDVFKLKLSSTGKIIEVPACQTAVEALEQAGIYVPTKCTDGLCGVCAVEYNGAEVEHRDFVLSKSERETKMTLCCSRSTKTDEIIQINL